MRSAARPPSRDEAVDLQMRQDRRDVGAVVGDAAAGMSSRVAVPGPAVGHPPESRVGGRAHVWLVDDRRARRAVVEHERGSVVVVGDSGDYVHDPLVGDRNLYLGHLHPLSVVAPPAYANPRSVRRACCTVRA